MTGEIVVQFLQRDMLPDDAREKVENLLGAGNPREALRTALEKRK
jgi:hypothetical protein